MAKRKQSSKRRQARHKRQGKSSQFDKRQRLNTVNPHRKKTSRAKVPLVGALAATVSSMSRLLDPRMAFRLSIVMAGLMLADDRRVAAAWFTAAGVQDDWDRFYDCLISVGRNTQPLALPLLKAVLQKFVRAVDVPPLQEKYGWEFQTKHQLAVKLMTWFVNTLRSLGVTCQIRMVADGAYATSKVLKPLKKLGVVLFSRLRKDAALFDLPPERRAKQLGRPRIYGVHRISLSKLANHGEGWQTITYHCRGGEVVRQYKEFLATSHLVGGVIRVVIVRFDDGGWAPYFCMDAQVEVRDILETVAARWAIEEHFHDVKEVWGAGQQQVRNVWSNLGCWHLNQWMYTFVELCCWDVDKSELSDRRDRPWDNTDRRPSHADRRRSISREMLGKQFLAALPHGPDHRKLWTLFQDLISLAA